MKKTTLLLIALITIVIGTSLTSCDAIIADSLEGTWEGDMFSVAEWGGESYDATYTELEFSLNPFSFKSGKGYWVDYYKSNHPWGSNDYIANHMSWTVKNQVIYIHLEEDNVDLEIRHYSLNDEHFEGEIYYNGITRKFSLVHTSSPNWDSYDYDDDDYDDYYDYSKSAESFSSEAKGVRNDGATNSRPQRSLRTK